MTERALLADVETAERVLASLRQLGVSVAIDDFGTGHSSLSRLKIMPVDILKIDRSFVDEVATSAVDRAIVATVVRLAQAVGLSTVAEGVETREQLDLLAEIGCDYAQGFLLAGPVPAAEATSVIAPARARPVPALTG